MRVLLGSLIFALAWGLGVERISFGAPAAGTLMKAKQEAEAKGYAFIASRDEILVKAKKEGKLRVLAGMEAPNIKATSAAFVKKYPFINLQIQEIQGQDAAQRNILEIKSGAKDWDVHRLSTDRYPDYVPYLFKIDLLGMAEQGILRIPPQMIDPKNRNAVAFYNRFQATAYNKNLLSGTQIPRTWEDLLKPEFKGRKFMMDPRALSIAALVPAWGLEKTLDYARKTAAQQPVWVGSGTRGISVLRAGEIPVMVGPNFTAIKRAQAKDPTGVLQYVIFEPVPLRLGELEGIQVTCENLHAALLWFEWMASPEAQKLADEHEPLASSVHVSGGAIERELRGKKLSVVDWENQVQVEEWQAKIVEAFGFPKAETGK
jgi:ABC-type Fe3+ transport system substrate-binding protein